MVAGSINRSIDLNLKSWGHCLKSLSLLGETRSMSCTIRGHSDTNVIFSPHRETCFYGAKRNQRFGLTEPKLSRNFSFVARETGRPGSARVAPAPQIERFAGIRWKGKTDQPCDTGS